MTAPALEPPVPLPDPDTQGFWDATAQGSLAVSRCTECARWQQPPTERCRHCGGVPAFEPVTGRGTIYSFIVVRQQTVPGHAAPYVCALVELDESPDVRLTAIVRCAPEDARVGLRVEAVIAPVGSSGFAAPEFVPAD